MSLRARAALLVFAAVFAAAPSLASPLLACGSCCCAPPPCHESPSGCDATLAAASCCDPAQSAVPSVAKPTLEVQGVHAALSARHAACADRRCARPPARATDLARLLSPSRLSVVLLI